MTPPRAQPATLQAPSETETPFGGRDRAWSQAASLWVPTIIIAGIYVPYVYRPVRGQVLSVIRREFVEAAIAQGASNLRLIFSEILPNVVPSVAAFFPTVREYSRRYGLDARRMGLLQDHALVLHPGPMVRGMEITADVADSDRSVIVEQVTNGVAVRMAVLYLLLGGATPAEPFAATPEGDAL